MFEIGLMNMLFCVDEERCLVVLWEGIFVVIIISCNVEMLNEIYLLWIVFVWMKVNGRKVKINVIFDDVLNEIFLNEEVVGILGL